MSLEPGTQLDAYEIVAPLGAGGMGEVYRARDTKLGREVAIKTLPADVVTDDSRRERFEQEARTASALNHPAIVTIYGVGAHAGAPYIAMELVTGNSLEELIGTGLSKEDVIRYATELAAGLSAAHAAGIVHRDLKPANLMVTSEGHVKILDFGLAKLRPADVASLAETVDKQTTSPGTILGTLGYMSPEQARGEELDFRADQFALGAVIYEMATQKPAFRRASAAETLAAVLNEDYASMARANLPSELKTIVARCLAKNPAERFPTTIALLDGLRELSRNDRVRDERPFVAVLPFKNLGAERADDYFSDGLTEEIIADLSSLSTVRVISSRSSMSLKDSDKDSASIGRELGVDYLLEGTVRKAATAIRITAQLAATDDDAILWTGKYKGSLEDIFAIQEEISSKIVEGLRVKLSPDDAAQMHVRPIENIQAYECYQKARHEIWRATEASLARALGLIDSALGIIGDNALLYHAKGMAHVQFVHAALQLDPSHLEQAEECVRRIDELEPESANGYTLRAFLDYKAGHLKDAARATRRALEIDPNNADAMFWYCLHIHLGQIELARPVAARALQLDPLFMMTHFTQGLIEMVQGRFDAAAEATDAALRLDPDNTLAIHCCAIVRIYARRFDEASEYLSRLQTSDRPPAFQGSARFIEHCLAGRRDEALEAMTPEWTDYMWNDEYFAWNVSSFLAMIGEDDRALDWLEQTTGPGEFINYPLFSQVDPFLAKLRGNPRFESIMARVRDEWLAYGNELASILED